MTRIQEALRNGLTFEELDTTYGVRARRHRDFPNLVLLKYNQIASNFQHELVRECRGIVLDESEDWRIVCRAFDKFGNLGEGYAADIDWTTARVQEKLDGSLATLYHYAGDWRVATSGTPDATGDVHGNGLTFHDYFWNTFQAEGGRLPANENLCFSFELMGPMNRIVVVHEKPTLRLLSVRHRTTGQQFAPEAHVHEVQIPAVRTFPLGSIEALQATFDGMSPLAQEGYVVVDAQFNRIKVKSPQYVALHHAKDGMTTRAFVEIARSGETSEVEAVFPELAKPLNEVRAKYTAFVERCEAEYAPIAHIEAQKDFAFEALKTGCSSAMFMRRKGVDFRDFFKGIHVDRLAEWMNVEVQDETIAEAAE